MEQQQRQQHYNIFTILLCVLPQIPIYTFCQWTSSSAFQQRLQRTQRNQQHHNDVTTAPNFKAATSTQQQNKPEPSLLFINVTPAIYVAGVLPTQ